MLTFDDENDLTDAEILDEISRQVHSFWFRYPWWKHVRDVASEWQYIQAMRTKYVFPDYFSLVGEPTERDFSDPGGLTTKRQAELLLIGVFSWQGYTIARHPAVYGVERWYGHANWQPQHRGWYATTDPVPQKLTFKNFFKPFAHLARQRLERVILDALGQSPPPGKSIEFVDGNVYNCHPDNLRIKEKRGRPMVCVWCKAPTTKESSERIKIDDRNQRYCHDCLNMMTSWQEDKNS